MRAQLLELLHRIAALEAEVGGGGTLPIGSVTFPLTFAAGVLGSKAAETTFVVDPLAVVGGNVYNTLAQAAVDMARTPGPKTVMFRGATAVIAAGAYNLGANTDVIEFTSDQAQTALTIADGVTFPNAFPTTFSRLSILWHGATPAIQPTATTFFYFKDSTGLVGQGAGQTAPFIRANAGVFLGAFFLDQGTISTSAGGSPPITAVGAGAQVIFSMFDVSNMASNSIGASAGGSVIVGVVDSAAAALPQAGIPGGVLVVNSTLFFASDSSRVVYSDAAPAIAAINVQTAIDKLKRYAQSFSADSGAVASMAAPTQLVALPAIDLLASESLVITASVTFNKDVTPGSCELIIEVDGATVGNKGTSSDSIISNGSATASRTVQVKPAAGNRVVSVVGLSIGGDASLLAGGASVVARRVLA